MKWWGQIQVTEKRRGKRSQQKSKIGEKAAPAKNPWRKNEVTYRPQ